MKPFNTDIFLRETEDAYHAQAKDHLSSHQLADFRKCPFLYRKRRMGLIEDQDRPAYLVGRAGHKLILEGREAFSNDYAVGGPVNPRTQKPFGANTKAWAEWAEAQCKPVLSHDQMILIESMATGVKENQAAQELLLSGLAEGVVRAEYHGISCQIRLDWFNPDAGIVDLKTCDDLTWFECDAKRYGYVHQVAFYRAVLAQASGQEFPVHFIAIEKKEPFRAGVWRVSEDVLSIARQENEQAIDRLLECIKTDHWPTGYEAIRIFDSI